MWGVGDGVDSAGLRAGAEKRPLKLEGQGDFDPRQRRRADEAGSSYGVAQRDGWDDKDGHYIITLGDSLLPRYKILKVIGEGTFGKVTQCWDRQEKKYVAIKIIKSIQKYREAAKVEIEILKDIDRRDVNHASGVITMLESFDFRGHFCLVFDLLGMSMYDFLRQNSYRAFSLAEVQEFGKQLIRTVKFLHSMNLIHTDLKLENILFVDSDWEYHRHPVHVRSRVVKRKEIVVIDLGSATYESEHHASIVSTRHYRAPEVVLGLGWTFHCDLWSVGCILLELFTGEATFQTHENLEHLAMMQKLFGKIPPTMMQAADRRSVGRHISSDGELLWPDVANQESIKAVQKLKPLQEMFDLTRQDHAQFYDLCKRLLTFEPNRRISARDALEHPFFRVQVKPDYTAASLLKYPDAPVPPSTMPPPPSKFKVQGALSQFALGGAAGEREAAGASLGIGAGGQAAALVGALPSAAGGSAYHQQSQGGAAGGGKGAGGNSEVQKKGMPSSNGAGFGGDKEVVC